VSGKPHLLTGTSPSCLVEEGLHDACLVAVRRFGNAYGPRIGFEFELEGREHLMASAAPSTNLRGKLAELLRGLLGRDPLEAELEDPTHLIGALCKVLVRTEYNKAGKPYAAITQAISATSTKRPTWSKGRNGEARGHDPG
jgi:hypothetical protein